MGANVLPGALGLLGTDLIGAKGETVKTETLAGKGRVLGLYFSAHWCPPCRGFTPKLAEFYKHFRSGPDGHKLEIVFVSSDKTEAEFRDYCKEMPWLVLPFGDRDRKSKLSQRFKVQGIPTLIMVNCEDGSVITRDGRQCVVDDPEGKEFPWRPKPLGEIVEGVLINSKGEETKWGDLASKIVGFYFSAHWCPPCKAFTPELEKTYNKIVGDSKPLEIIFVSSDRSQEMFQNYFNTMPWLAIPYGDPRAKDVSKYFGVEGIPSLVFLNQERKIITSNGRNLVMVDRDGKDFPWIPKPLQELNTYSASVVNEEACVIYFSDNDEGSIGHAIEVLKPLAEKHTKSQNEGGADPTLYFLYSTVNDISESLRDFARIPDEDNVLVILDIPSGLVFISDDEELTSDKAGKFISDFLSGKLKGRSLSGKQTCV